MHQQGAYRILLIPFFVMRYLSQECFKSFGIDFYTTVHAMTMIAIKLKCVQTSLWAQICQGKHTLVFAVFCPCADYVFHCSLQNTSQHDWFEAEDLI